MEDARRVDIATSWSWDPGPVRSLWLVVGLIRQSFLSMLSLLLMLKFAIGAEVCYWLKFARQQLLCWSLLVSSCAARGIWILSNFHWSSLVSSCAARLVCRCWGWYARRVRRSRLMFRSWTLLLCRRSCSTWWSMPHGQGKTSFNVWDRFWRAISAGHLQTAPKRSNPKVLRQVRLMFRRVRKLTSWQTRSHSNRRVRMVKS